MADNNNTQFDTKEVLWEDEEMRQRIEKRRRASHSRKIRRKLITLFAAAVVFVLLGSMYGRDIIRLKAENRALKKQQIALEMQREELQEELKKANNQEYIREQAKKQLRLLNPGEILFTFDEEAEPEVEDGEKSEEDKAEETEETGGSDG